jgi:hypothetical protein
VPAAIAEPAPQAWLAGTLAAVLESAARLIRRQPDLAAHWPEERGPGATDKLLGEAAMLLLAAHRAMPGHAAVAALAEAMEEPVRGRRAQALLMRSCRNAELLFLPHHALNHCGRGDAAMDARLGQLPPGLGEMLPFRAAERAWLASLLPGAAWAPPPLGQDHVLARMPPVFEAHRGDLYAVTHWALYATDLGRHPAPEALRQGTLAMLDEAIAWQLAAEDLDLLGELLLAARLLRLPQEGPAIRAGWALLRGTWDLLGFLPSPSFSAGVFGGLQGPAREAYVAAHTYHTVFVLGLLCAAELQAGAAEPPAPPPVADGDDPFWLRLLGGCDWALPVILDARLIQAVRAYDLAGLARAMEQAMASGLPPSPVFGAALAFLDRQRLPGGEIGAQFLLPENRAHPAAAVIRPALLGLLERATQWRAAA